jgi:predicted nuclease of predicted toxin-antitoxin system
MATKGGRPDPEVMALAIAENAILLTEDSDFGRLIFGQGLTPPPGVILVTMTGLGPGERAANVRRFAPEAVVQAQGALVVFEAGGLRRKPFARSGF